MSQQDITITEGSGNVFLDLGFDPAEADMMRPRAEVTIRMAASLEAQGRSRADLNAVPRELG